MLRYQVSILREREREKITRHDTTRYDLRIILNLVLEISNQIHIVVETLLNPCLSEPPSYN